MKTTVLTKSQKTQERILKAATKEFATYGVAGARVDRIALSAKANKSLIYDYFGSKDQLFTKVLEEQLAQVYRSIAFSPDNLPQYAVHLFDFAMDHPLLMRLVMWNSLQEHPVWPLDPHYSLENQVQAIAQQQSKGHIDDSFSPQFLLTLILSLASGWTAASPIGKSIMPNPQKERETLRADIARTVERLCAKAS